MKVISRAKGRLRGEQPKLNRRQKRTSVSLMHRGEYRTAEVT